MKIFDRLNANTMLVIIAILYAGLSIYLFSKYGVKIMNDSPRYLTYADNLSGGIYFDPLNFWYISYVFFIAFVKLFSTDNTYIILAQYILGFVAVLAVYGSAKRLTKNRKIGFLAAGLFMIFPDNLMWHSYVLTESFYCSVLCITFYLLVRLSQERSFWLYGITGLLILISFFSKPTSPALIIALTFPFVWKWLRSPPARIAKLGSLVVMGILFLFLANKMISSHRVMLIYENGDIIFAMHEFPSHPHHDWMTVDIPEDLYKPPTDQPLLQQMGTFVIANPVYFAKLFFGKMIMYVTHIRTYWSWPHNISVMLTLWVLYYFSIKTIQKKLISNYFAKGSIMYFVIHTLVVSSTWADWDGRFFVPMIPMVVVLGVIGISNALGVKSAD